MNQGKSYDLIDLCKFIAAIVIVALHAAALYDISPILNTMILEGLGRICVPFFFVSSAFFFFLKKKTWDDTKKYCKRMLILYAAWFIVSLPKTIFDRFICSGDSFGLTLYKFIRSFFVESTFSGSWFIVSCIFCALLFYYLEKFPEKKRKTITIIISIVVYAVSVFTSAYGNLLEPLGLNKAYKIYTLIFASPFHNIFTGIPYFALGRYFARRENIKKPTPVLPVLCILLLLAEVYFTNTYEIAKATDCYLMLLPCIFFIFPFIATSNIKIKHAKDFRITSTILFFSHFLLLFVCEIAEYIFKITIPNFGKFMFALVMGMLLSLFVIKVKNNERFKLIRYFY